MYKMKSVEELLQPRYLVEFDEYPGAEYVKGLVIEFEDEKQTWFTGKPEYVSKFYLLKEAGGYIGGQCESFFAKFPKVYRKLEWWEMREESDMPEYISIRFEPFHITSWKKSDLGNWLIIGEPKNENETELSANIAWHFGAKKSKPITETEYINYINTQQ